ncbi:MAG: secondary thiamine-phosphate synthase enzyme YjbQ [Candidatus Muiribacteriota bacterium]
MIFTIDVKTDSKTEMIDITQEVSDAVKKSGVKSGIAVVFIPHTTAAVTINENADPAVKMDMLYEINKVIPFNDNYKHCEGNSAAHIKTSLFGPSLSVIFENGELILGTWQDIYFAEFDGPRNRKAYIKIVAG